MRFYHLLPFPLSFRKDMLVLHYILHVHTCSTRYLCTFGTYVEGRSNFSIFVTITFTICISARKVRYHKSLQSEVLMLEMNNAENCIEFHFTAVPRYFCLMALKLSVLFRIVYTFRANRRRTRKVDRCGVNFRVPLSLNFNPPVLSRASSFTMVHIYVYSLHNILPNLLTLNTVSKIKYIGTSVLQTFHTFYWKSYSTSG